MIENQNVVQVGGWKKDFATVNSVHGKINLHYFFFLNAKIQSAYLYCLVHWQIIIAIVCFKKVTVSGKREKDYIKERDIRPGKIILFQINLFGACNYIGAKGVSTEWSICKKNKR